ncbi:MAG: calcium-binding protein [Rubrobacteraceae bacterium]
MTRAIFSKVMWAGRATTFCVGLAVMFGVGATALAATGIQCQDGECRGTAGPDLMKGTGSSNQMYAGEGDDMLKGFDGPDYLRGDAGNDQLFGGRVRDSLEGGPGKDVLSGGGGDDSYDLRGYNWGHDTLIDRAVPDSGAGTGNLLWLNHYGGEDLVVDLVAGPGSEVRSEGGAAAGWEGNVIDKAIDLSDGDDLLKGNDRANFLAAYDGDDDVRGRAGDDLIDVGDGSGGDTVRCGKGEDTVIRDLPDPVAGGPGDAIAANCEVQQDPDVAVLD